MHALIMAFACVSECCWRCFTCHHVWSRVPVRLNMRVCNLLLHRQFCAGHSVVVLLLVLECVWRLSVSSEDMLCSRTAVLPSDVMTQHWYDLLGE